MLITSAFASCTNESEDLNNLPGKNLKVSFNVAEVQSRAIFNEASLPTASVVGAKLDGYVSYSSITFTAAGTGQAQTWTPSTDVVLGEDQGTLYTYYPYSQNTDISAIPVDMTEADQTDWLYGTPVTGVSEDKANVTVTLNHALANINLTLVKGSYVGTGNVTAISVQSDGIAPKGTFNAAQETPAYSAYEDEGTAIERAVTTTLGGTAIDIMVVPTGQSAAITFNVTVDGTVYTATSSAVQLEMGSSYKYTLTLNSTFMSVSEVAVTQWNPITKDNLTLEKYVDTTPQVYAVSSTGALMDVANADESCIAVALVVGEHKFWIEKTQSYDATNIKFYWGENLEGKDVAGITEISTGNGYLPKANGSYESTPNLSSDYTTWTSGGLSDFNGKNNTNAIITAYAEHSVEMNAQDMCVVLQTFNAGTYGSNQGFTDWYIPSLGQLALIYLNKTAINEALTAIGGTTFSADFYWCSSEKSSYHGWRVEFFNGLCGGGGKSNGGCMVRFVRDI